MKKYMEEYVKINDVEQYFLHLPANSDKLVIYLHGGPGQSEAFFAHQLQPEEEYCNFVYYDQRGTGKTQARNKTSPLKVRMNYLMEDLRTTVDYLKEKYRVSKVVLVGHSWGSVLGMEYTKLFSNTISAYVGMGQVINLKRGERVGYEKLGESIDPIKNPRDYKKYIRLNTIYEEQGSGEFIACLSQIRKLQAKYGYAFDMGPLIKDIFKSPIFSVKDVAPYLACMKNNTNLLDFLMAYDTTECLYYRIPMFFICGRDDWQVPSVLVEEYMNRIQAPVKELFWVENAGHAPNLDDPKRYHEILRQVCESI